jgi:hypothetical protein
MTQTKVTILLAVAGGLATVSFKTPKIYKKIHWFIGAILLVLFFMLITFMQGYSTGIQEVLKYIKPDQIEATSKLLKENNELSENLYYFVFGAAAYMGFLYWLACEVIEHSDNKKPE